MTVQELASKYHVSVATVKKQLDQGIPVEMEHTNRKGVAREIALDHLDEDLYYYDKLKKIEKQDLNESRSRSVIVVDVQPEYSGIMDGDENPVFEEIIKFVNNQLESTTRTSKQGAPGTLKAKIDGKVTCAKVNALKKRANATPHDKAQANWFINMHGCDEQQLQEIFDQPAAKDINWRKYPYGMWETNFNYQGLNVIVEMNHDVNQDGARFVFHQNYLELPSDYQGWNVIFRVDKQTDVTGKFGIQSVGLIARVLQVIQSFLKQHPWDYVVFSGQEGSRNKLYQALSERFAQKFNLKLATSFDDFVVYKPFEQKNHNLDEVTIDNVKGLGNVPDNDNVDYLGLRVQMKPSGFLKLAAHLPRHQATSVDHIKAHIQQGNAIAAPWLNISIPGQWEQGDFSMPAKVRGHEGRNRMYAVKELEGDNPIETHLFFSGGLRARHIKPEWIEQLNQQLIPERSNSAIQGPFFNMNAQLAEVWSKEEIDQGWEESSRGLWKNYFEIQKPGKPLADIEIQILKEIGPHVYTIEFDVGGSMDITRQWGSLASSIFSEIFRRLRGFFSSHPWNKIRFEASEQEPLRVKLYQMLANKIAREINGNVQVDKIFSKYIRFTIIKPSVKIHEAFDWKLPKKDWKIVERRDNWLEIDFQVEDHPYNLQLTSFGKTRGVYDVVFGSLRSDDPIGITGEGNAFKVFSAVKQLLDYARTVQTKVKISGFFFTGKEPSRKKLYAQLAPRLAKSWGWVYTTDPSKFSYEVNPEFEQGYLIYDPQAIKEAAGVGLVVPGVNMPTGMHKDEIQRQAKKMGFKVSKTGVPPLIYRAQNNR
jgi:hypothetical protein